MLLHSADDFSFVTEVRLTVNIVRSCDEVLVRCGEDKTGSKPGRDADLDPVSMYITVLVACGTDRVQKSGLHMALVGFLGTVSRTMLRYSITMSKA